MARYPRIRRRHFTGPNTFSSPRRPSMTPEQRQWLARWKEQAVRQLPFNAPLQVKIQLRQEVEQALARYEPADPAQEVQDIVTMLVEQATRRIEDAAQAIQRERQKAFHLRLADLGLQLALRRCPASVVGPPGSPRRQQMLASLRPKLRAALVANLTGEESEADVLRQTVDWVLAWQADQELAHGNRLSPGRIVTCVSGAVAFVDAMTKVPAVRDAVTKGLSAVRAHMTHLTPPPDPPKPATG